MVSKRSAPFFKRLLTSRHLLTRRSLAIVWGGSLAILVPVLWWRMPASSPKPFGGHSRPVQLVSNAAEAVTVLTARVGDAGPAYMQQSFTGIVKPRRSSWLAAKAIGRVNKIWAEMGDPIAAGELLIELDLATLDAQRATTTARLAAAQAQWNELQQGPRHQDIDQAVERVTEISATLQLSEANFRRMESLANSNSISRQELDEAKFTLEATRAQLAAARHALDLLREGTRQEQLSAAEATVGGWQAE